MKTAPIPFSELARRVPAAEGSSRIPALKRGPVFVPSRPGLHIHAAGHQDDDASRTEAFRPAHLATAPTPRPVREAEEAQRIRGSERYVFRDLAYPWAAIGRVETAVSEGSGVMVGPRHMLTAAHLLDWDAEDRAPGWLRFTPAAFQDKAPFGDAFAVAVHASGYVDPPTIDYQESARDFAVITLDWDIGDITGWMGACAYDDRWDGHEAWCQAGYAQGAPDYGRPSFAGALRLDGDDEQPAAGQAIYHAAPVQSGHSGGPIFGWWEGEVGPRVVAVQSWSARSAQGGSGGSDMVALIARAQAEGR